MKLRCTSCDLELPEGSKARCPECLRTSTLEPARHPNAEKRVRSGSLFFGPGFLVTMAILVPAMFLIRERSMPTTFAIAFVAFGLGHAVNALWRRR